MFHEMLPHWSQQQLIFNTLRQTPIFTKNYNYQLATQIQCTFERRVFIYCMMFGNAEAVSGTVQNHSDTFMSPVRAVSKLRMIVRQQMILNTIMQIKHFEFS